MFTELQRERAYPYVLGGAAFLWTLGVSRLHYDVPYNDDLLASLVSLGGIFAGFLATLKTLLSAIGEAAYIRLKQSGYLHDLLLYLKEAIWGSLALCVCAMFGFSNAMSQPIFHCAVLFGLLFFSLAALYRITKISMNLLSSR
jgi:hypothetical protein